MTINFHQKAIEEKNKNDLYFENCGSGFSGPRADEYDDIKSEADYHMKGAIRLMKEKGLDAKEAVTRFLNSIGYKLNDFYVSSLAIEIEKKLKGGNNGNRG